MLEPPAPKAAELSKYDVIWHGIAHRNLCVRLHAGRAVIAVDGSPDYELYVEPQTYTYARETPGQITIATPDTPHGNGTVCLGIATSGTASTR